MVCSSPDMSSRLRDGSFRSLVCAWLLRRFSMVESTVTTARPARARRDGTEGAVLTSALKMRKDCVVAVCYKSQELERKEKKTATYITSRL